MSTAIAVGVLVAAGTDLILQRGLVRIAFGFILLGHAVNLVLVASGGLQRRGAPFIGQRPTDEMADPLPQAFVLTAIVITFGITVYLLALARASVGSTEEQADEPSTGPATAPPADDAPPAAPGGNPGRDDRPPRGGAA